MSKRLLIGVLVALCTGPVVAETGTPGGPAFAEPIVRLGSSAWLLYRPAPRAPQVHDLDYMMDRLRCDQSGFGLRFRHSAQFSLDLTLAPLTDYDDYVGPVYDMDIGATRLVVTLSF